MTDEITIAEDIYAPPEDRYYAHYGDLDVDTQCGHGRTPLEAVTDLFWLTET